MAKELERESIPVAHICTMINVAMALGANRIVPSSSVLYPTGNPNITIKEESNLRMELINKAIQALKTEVDKPTILEVMT